MHKKTYFTILLLILFSFCSANQHEFVSKNGMVVSSYDLASHVGVDILKSGGNAVDAAVATGFALSVVFPTAGNLGGGGFMVIRFPDGNSTSIDFREKAPLKAHRDMFLSEEGVPIKNLSLKGYLASGVPGSVAGLTMALEKYGTMPLKQVIAPAIALAKNGFRVSDEMNRDLSRLKDDFLEFPASARVFLKPDGEPFSEGELFVQPDLAHTLALISNNGSKAFYEGEIAEKIAADMEKHGGLISLADLREYEALERTPVRGFYRGHEIISMGPPSSGGIALIQALNVLEGFDLTAFEFNSVEYAHILSEILKRVYADRAAYLGDSDYVNVPLAQLMDKSYADVIRGTIDSRTATPSTKISPGLKQLSEGMHTTHYSVIDESRMTVAVTTTINTGFGSRVVIDGTGFLMNNEMDDFTVKPGAPNTYDLVMYQANSIEPGKRMLSSMSPTIVTKDGEVMLTVGAMGGPKIITAVLQVILNVIDFGMTADQAVTAPRIHHQWLPDRIDYETPALSEDVKSTLESLGHQLRQIGHGSEAHMIIFDKSRGLLSGGADPRWEGTVAGY